LKSTAPDYVALLRSFEHRRDIREPNPGPTHLRAFRIGWNGGAEKKSYSPRVLETLTWQNLGNRLGLALGYASPEEQERALHNLAKDLRATRAKAQPKINK